MSAPTVTLGRRTYRLVYHDLLPEYDAETRARVKADIRARGVITPILMIDDDVIDGGHRVTLVAELLDEDPTLKLPLPSVPPNVPGRNPRDLTEAERQIIAINANLHRRHLSREQRDALITKMTEQGHSAGVIAQSVGLTRQGVQAAQTRAGCKNLQGGVRGADGKTYAPPARKATPPPPAPSPPEPTRDEQGAEALARLERRLKQEREAREAEERADDAREAALPARALAAVGPPPVAEEPAQNLREAPPPAVPEASVTMEARAPEPPTPLPSAAPSAHERALADVLAIVQEARDLPSLPREARKLLDEALAAGKLAGGRKKAA